MADRANLLGDVFNLAEAGELDYSVALNISLYLTEEHHVNPWKIASSKLKAMNSLLSSANQSSIILPLFQVTDHLKRLVITSLHANRNHFHACASTVQSFGRKLVNNIYHTVSWTVNDTLGNDTSAPAIDNFVRSTVLEFACAMNHTDALQEAGRLLKQWLNDSTDTRPHPDIRSIVYYFGSCS